MFTVKNISLDKIYEKYGTQSFNTLSEDKLRELCRELSITPIWKLDKQNRPISINVPTTVDAIERSCTVDEYMPQDFWTEANRALAVKDEILKTLAGHSEGWQTFKLFKSYKWGLYDLKPGETQTLDVPKDWITEDLLRKPCAVKLEIRDENNELLTLDTPTPTEPITTNEIPPVKADIDSFLVMKYSDLQKLAKAKGMEGVIGRTREELAEFLMK